MGGLLKSGGGGYVLLHTLDFIAVGKECNCHVSLALPYCTSSGEGSREGILYAGVSVFWFFTFFFLSSFLCVGGRE